ncbi:MAG TPA: 50S ribosomal protein L25 [Vicinamibacterales bacterium]|jgi:large subunit ribosomal protein L25|nr:50S ribosomal protein L25 [Vicinamibacterales bacterium]
MEATLDGLKRETFGKNEARRLRAQGRIPAVLYGGQKAGENAEPIAVDPKVLMRILHSESGLNTLIALSLNGSSTRVLVKEYQVDPVTHKLLHVDFYRIAMDKVLTVTVPVVVKGEPKGVKQQGGVLDFVHREVEVECLPADIPDKIEIDVSELLLNEAIRVRDVAPSPKFKIVTEGEVMLVHVEMPKAEEPEPTAVDTAAAATAAPAEPEVIKKGKVEKPEEEEEK